MKETFSTMEAVKLELKWLKSVNEIGIHPQPDWSFDTLLSEINSIEKQLYESSDFSLHFTEKKLRLPIRLPMDQKYRKSSNQLWVPKRKDSAKHLTTIFLDPSCLQSASITTFAETIVTLCTNGKFGVFPKAHIIVVVSSQIPLVMDVILAKLNKVCIYTVPKYICDVKTVYDSSKTYNKIIGYVEEDGEIESEESYISRMKSYIKLYGALVQTEIQNVRNTHGIEEGWAWLARFLNSLPANRYTAVALDAFLEVAGYSLHRKYRNQFKKLLNVVRHGFIKALKARRDHNELSDVITSIETYIERNKFLVEPEGRALPDDWKQPNYIDPDSTS